MKDVATTASAGSRGIFKNGKPMMDRVLPDIASAAIYGGT